LIYKDYQIHLKMPKEVEAATRDYTVILHKRVQGVQFKKKAPRAIKAIKKFARTNMRTEVAFANYIDLNLENYIWCSFLDKGLIPYWDIKYNFLRISPAPFLMLKIYRKLESTSN
jgi:ribosomal protein L31E